MTRPEPQRWSALPEQSPQDPRVLRSWDDYLTAVDAAKYALTRFRPKPVLDHGHFEEILTAAFAAVGVFEPAPATESLHPRACTALYLLHDSERFGPDRLGVWQQCRRTYHASTHHAGDGLTWSDGMPGTIPALHRDTDALETQA